MTMEETFRQIVREENEKHLEDIKNLLSSHGYQEAPRLLTVPEAAKILRMGRTATYELCRQKQSTGFPAFQDVEGGPIRVPYNSLMNWIDQQTKEVI